MKTKKLKYQILILISLWCTAQKNDSKYPFQNTNLTFEERVENLIEQLTLEEKVAQMLNAAPAIPRLGIPAYDWWNETLHGVARTPFKTTVFPQAIAMAATFDKNSLYKMADYSALEGRAIYNKAVELNRTNERYLGLTYWTPNINIFRDPRWGRGQETYGEDPFLTAVLGDAFVKGLQGDDPKYLKAAACAKHYAVHSLPINLESLAGSRGIVYGLDHFGYSAPASVLDQKFGFTAENISNEILKYLEIAQKPNIQYNNKL
ncbi:glycoside hydrolase family 3 N-terminal domain-containing protein [Flavobacterium tistrianum]|uniref:glycoside hydrolase family 3 N-terminal domain-containing protein n=1 Tax=Flavobacterium tistrianum TaxID=1685414 RepID=UPI003743EEC1